MIDIKKMLMADEGYKLIVYRCSAGYLTGGIGHNFEADPAFNIMQRPMHFGAKISPDEAFALFDYDVRKVMAGLNGRLPGFNDMPENYKAVLVNMAFQMGIGGLMRFKKMLAAMSFKDDKATINEIIDSKYYSDTRNRAKRMVALIRGNIPKEYL